jgi:protein regulator of cytokinesis 1
VFESSVGERLGFGSRVIEQLEEKAESLQRKQNEREEQVKEYAKQITALWERLGISQEERDSFFECHQGLGPAVITACAEELNRLLMMKEQRLKDLVLDCRQRIRTLWDSLGFADAQRRRFSQFFDTDFTEEVLDLHENEEKLLVQRMGEVCDHISRTWELTRGSRCNR